MQQPNLKYINQLADGNPLIKERLITVLKSEFPEEVSIYDRNIINLDFIEAAESVHKIRHKIALLGLEKDYLLCQTYENNLRKNDTQFQNEFKRILDKISEFIENI